MWLILAFITVVFYAVGAVLMKKAVGQIPKELVYLANAVYFLVFWLIYLAVSGNFEWNWQVALMAVFPGLGFVYALTAFEKAEAGLVSALGSIGPAITSVLAASFLGERLNYWQWSLVGLIVAGAVYMALPEKIKSKNTAWVWWGIGFGLLAGWNNFINKLGLNLVNTLSYSLTLAGWQLVLAIGWISLGRKWDQLPRLFSKKEMAGLLGAGVFNIGGVLFFFALGLGQASLVLPIVTLYVPLICLLAWWWLKEKMTRREIIGAGVIVLSVIGLSLMS